MQEDATFKELFDDATDAPEPEGHGSLWSRAMATYTPTSAEAKAPTETAAPSAPAPAAPVEAPDPSGELALVVGTKVEKVLVEKLETREENMRKVAQGFAELVAEQSKRQLRVIELLESVPQVVALMKQGQDAQLQAIARTQEELARQNEERERAARERFEKAGERDTANAAKLEAAMNMVVASLHRGSQAESERWEKQQATAVQKADRFERALTRLAVRTKDQSDAMIRSHEDAATAFQRSHQDVYGMLEKAQSRTVEALERLHQERAREDARKWRRTMAVGGAFASLCAALVIFALFVFVRADRARAEVSERARAATSWGETTLPAGMRR